MGKGAFMVVINLDNRPHHLEVNDVNCMHYHNKSGSNLEIWNNVTIEPVSAIPAFGQPFQYIEADGGGGCAFEQSHFAIEFDQGGPDDGKAGINIQTSVEGVPVSVRYAWGPVDIGLSATGNLLPHSGQAGIGIMRLPSDPPKHHPFTNIEPDRWMEVLLKQRPEFRSRQLNSIALPASHDSGMSKAEPCTTWANARVTQTQTLTLRGQLRAGVRYFDLRPSRWGERGEFAFGHINAALGGQGCLGEAMDSGLDDVKTFLDSSPQEFVILKFSGYINSDAERFPLAVQRSMIAQIKRALGDQMFTASKGEKIGLFTVGDILSGRRRAICVFQDLDPTLVDPEDGILLYGGLNAVAPGDLPGNYADSNFDLYDSYSDSENSVQMIVDQISKYRRFSESKLLNGEMFLLSHTLTLSSLNSTPAGAQISILDLARRVNRLLWDVVTSICPPGSEGEGQRPPNLIYVDEVNTVHPVLVALYLNSQVSDPLRLPRIAIRSTVFRNVYLRLDPHSGSGEANCQVGVGPFERFHLERAKGDNCFYLKSVEFGVYLTLSGEGATKPNPRGLGRSGFSETKVPAALFHVHPSLEGTFTIESTVQAGLYLRMYGQDLRGPSQRGGGVVNGQIGASTFETFVFGPA